MIKHNQGRWSAVLTLATILMMISATGVSALELKLSLIDTPVVRYRTAASADSGIVEKSIRLGDPIYVRIELINNTTQPVELMPSVNPAVGFVRLFIVSGDTLDTPFTTLRWETRDYYLEARELQPGERLVHETFLFGKFPTPTDPSSLRYLFPESGTYQLYARYECPQPPVEVESNRVTVSVGQPIAQWDRLRQAGIIGRLEGRSLSPAFDLQQKTEIQEMIQPVTASPFAPWFTETPVDGAAKLIEDLPLSRAAVEDILTSFINAWNAGDIDRAKTVLADDFVCNGALDRETFGELLAEGHADLAATGRPAITFDAGGITPLDNNVTVDFVLHLSNEGVAELGAQHITIELALENERWVIKKWQRQEP